MSRLALLLLALCLPALSAATAGGLGTPMVESGIAPPALPRSFASAAVNPDDLAQLSLELLNRARANPAAEAASFGIDLNEGLTPGTISSTAKEPLAFNPYLIDAAEQHSQWMIDNDVFSHDEGVLDPGDRMAAAGYTFSGSYTWGENLAWNGSSQPNTPNPITSIIGQHEALFVDSGIVGRGHRRNILNDNFREVGIGIIEGQFTSGSTWNAVMQSQDFAHTSIGVANPFITGVVCDDSVTDDDFYTPGEGWGGVTIAIINPGNGSTIASTTTWSTGGYRVAIPAGTYTVRASGGAMVGSVNHNGVVVSSANVKVDFDPTNTQQRQIRMVLIPSYDWDLSPTSAAASSDATHQTFGALNPSSDHRLSLTPTAPD